MCDWDIVFRHWWSVFSDTFCFYLYAVCRELFGREDTDYRSLPPIPKLRPMSPRRQPLLGPAPHSGLTSPQAVGWANFKASRPDDFPLDHRDSVSNTDLRNKGALLPTPSMESGRDGFEEKPDFSSVEESDGHKMMSTKDLFLKTHGDEGWQRGGDRGHDMHYPRSSSRSPVHRPVFYNDRPVPMDTSILGDGPHDDVSRHHERGPWPLCEHEQHRVRPCCEHEEPRVLLPTPANSRLPAAERYNNRTERDRGAMELWEAPVRPVYDEDCFYMPDFDVRWRMRAQAVDNAFNTYTVVIDGRQFEMNLNDRPRFIKCHTFSIKVALNGYNSYLVIDDFNCYRFGSLPSEIRLHGADHTVFVRGPQKKLWIDDNLFEINVDAPPEMVNVDGRRHEIQIDSGSNSFIVDGHRVCEYGSEGVQDVQLAFVLHRIQFSPPRKSILIDGQLCTLDMTGKYPVVWMNGRPRGIRFDGPPRYIYIDDLPYLVPMDWARKCRIDGPKPRLLAFGGPGHEVIIDDQWFEVKFGGAEKLMKFGGHMHKIQLRGDPPEVKILPEVLLKDQLGRNMGAASRGFASSDLQHHIPAMPGSTFTFYFCLKYIGLYTLENCLL